MKALKSKKKVNACAFLRTFPRRCEIYPLRHGRGGRARRRGGEKNVGTFFENKGTFLGKWGGKGENPWAFRTDLGRKGARPWRNGATRRRVGGAQGRRERVEGGRKGARSWRNGAARRHVGGAQGRQEWVHRGRKGAQEAAVQEIMRIFVAD